MLNGKLLKDAIISASIAIDNKKTEMIVVDTNIMNKSLVLLMITYFH